ncbi:MAG: 50S ribosomal protein L21 [Thaumarchaeota archaeon]|nr:MAG: 50S ribosomal protein L21 [Nitrososphaerota archaeon]
MARSHGYRRRTRSLLRSKGVRGLSSILREYSLNDRVVIKIDPAQVKGMPHRRFNGLVGVVKDVGTRVLTIEVPVGEKMKVVIARKEHVSPLVGRR